MALLTLSETVEYFRRATVHMLSHKAEYGMLTDRLGHAFHRLGLKRQPRDVTPTLSEYLAALRQSEAEANKSATEEGGASGMGAAHG